MKYSKAANSEGSEPRDYTEPSHIELPLDEIEIDPENVRSEYDPAILSGLRRALSMEGRYINPPAVYPIGQHRYRVKHGNTRVLAARGVVDRMVVRVVDPPTNESGKLLSQMGENLLQGSLRPADIGVALKRLRQADDRERSLSQIVGALKAAGLERTKSWVSMHIALTELAPEVQRLINRGSIAAETAYQLRGLPADEQVSWAQRVADEGLSVVEVKRLLGGDQSTPDSPTDQFLDALSEAGQALATSSQPGRRRVPDVDHRNSRTETRIELLPVTFEESELSQSGERAEELLIKEAAVLGNYTHEAAAQLASQALTEAASSDATALQALNVLRRLIQEPERLPKGALGDYLVMRAQHVVAALSRV